MTDIVERLRNSLIDELRDRAEGDDLYSEAADEIERLQTLIKGVEIALARDKDEYGAMQLIIQSRKI